MVSILYTVTFEVALSPLWSNQSFFFTLSEHLHIHSLFTLHIESFRGVMRRQVGEAGRLGSGSRSNPQLVQGGKSPPLVGLFPVGPGNICEVRPGSEMRRLGDPKCLPTWMWGLPNVCTRRSFHSYLPGKPVGSQMHLPALNYWVRTTSCRTQCVCGLTEKMNAALMQHRACTEHSVSDSCQGWGCFL